MLGLFRRGRDAPGEFWCIFSALRNLRAFSERAFSHFYHTRFKLKTARRIANKENFGVIAKAFQRGGRRHAGCLGRKRSSFRVCLYKTFFYVKAFVHESIIFCANTTLPPPVSPTRLRNMLVSPDPPLLQYIPYNIGNGNIV